MPVHAGRALAELQDARFSFEADPLREGEVIEEPNAAVELGAVSLEQPRPTGSGRRQGRTEACGEILHGSTHYAPPSSTHPQSG